MLNSRLVFIFMFLLSILWVSSAQADTGTEGASFLEIPVGARPAAMGSAYSALAADAFAPVWNPAGLGFAPNAEVAGQHLSYLSAIHQESLSYVQPLGTSNSNWRAGFGVSAQYLGSGDVQGSDSLGNANGTFSSHYGAYGLSYGQALGSCLALGVSAKIIEAALSDVSAHAFAADLGSMYRLTDRLTLAGTLTNLGSDVKFLQQPDELPLEFHLGGAYHFSYGTLSTEGIYRKTGFTAARVGAEWNPISALAIRAGYRTDTTRELSALAGFSTGLGLMLWGQELDYAWVPLGELGNTQYFSFVIRWGASDHKNMLPDVEKTLP